MSEELHAEFDDVAAWTAEVALALGPQYRVPAGCRGSGSPAVLRWFLDRLGWIERPGSSTPERGSAVPAPSPPRRPAPGRC